MINKKLIAIVAAAAVLALGVGTAFATQQSTSSAQSNDPVVNATMSASDKNETAEGSENEAIEGRDSDESLSGSPAQKAGDAALQATGGGKVLEVEQADNPNAAYEVEVRKSDGNIAEVLLDGSFNVIDQTAGD